MSERAEQRPMACPECHGRTLMRVHGEWCPRCRGFITEVKLFHSVVDASAGYVRAVARRPF